MKLLARVLLALLWIGTLAVTIVWVLDVPVPFEPEPVTVLLGLVSAAVTAVVTEYARALEFEKYSAPLALAYGYVNNFVEPVITRLVDMASRDEQVQFYIYIPDRLSDLYPKAVELTMAEVRRAGYNSEVINLDLEAGRARDIMTVFKDGSGNIKYFDFPNTLLTLVSLVDYKTRSEKDSFDYKKERAEWGTKYIGAFRDEVAKLLKEKKIDRYVYFADKSLDFLDGDK